MATTVSKLANANQAVSETTAWTNPTNAYSDADSNAVASNVTGKNTTNTRSWGFPAFTTSDVPDDATITQVLIQYRYSSSTTGVTGGQLAVQGDKSGSTIGSATNETQVTTLTTHTLDITANVSLSDLRSANVVRARFGSTKGNTNTALTWNLEFVKLQVTWDYPSLNQTSFRTYADGTESGSTARAAQDTNDTVDVSSGDVAVGLRIRVQEGGGVAGQSGDDYQLFVSKNGGSYASLSGVIDQYDVTQTPTSDLTLSSSFPSGGQTMTGDGRAINNVTFGLWAPGGTPGTGPMVAKIYAHTGTFGGGGVPTGSALATSDPVNVTDVTSTSNSTPTLIQFTFSGANKITLTAGTHYAVVVDVSGATSPLLALSDITSSPTHSGNSVQANASFTWSAFTTADALFSLTADASVAAFDSANLTEGGATTNRLGAGSGSFVAGKISEDGEVDNLQITASNYTELLYSLTLVAAGLANGDTLDFKVYRNGSPIGTYTKVPRITVSKNTFTPNYTRKVLLIN